MGYSDKPLSEHSLTGTRIRPLIKKTQQEGQGRVGREAQRHRCVTKTPMPTSVPSTSFDDPQRLHTCHNKLPTFQKKHFKHYSTTPNCAVRAI